MLRSPVGITLSFATVVVLATQCFQPMRPRRYDQPESPMMLVPELTSEEAADVMLDLYDAGVVDRSEMMQALHLVNEQITVKR